MTRIKTRTNVVTARAGKTLQSNMNCPACTVERDYQWYKVRNWFTLYFIPLISLNVVGEYIECGACDNTYETEAVGYDANGDAPIPQTNRDTNNCRPLEGGLRSAFACRNGAEQWFVLQ